MPTYKVTKVKTFKGREGEGFNADLLKDGKKVAEVINDASGGEVDFHWLDFKSPSAFVNNWVGYQGQPTDIRCTPEEASFYEFLRGKAWDIGAGIGRASEMVQHDPQSYVGVLVDKFLNDKRFRRLCKTQTLFRLTGDEEGTWHVIKIKFTPVVRARMTTRYPNLDTVMNETFATEDANS